MTSHRFSRWRPRHRNFTSDLVFGDFEVEIYLDTKYRWHFSTQGWNIGTSSFCKQTSAMLKFYFRFRFSRLRHHLHVILHLMAKFCPNRIIYDRLMTSYWFFKLAATASQLYFRFRFSWLCGHLGKSNFSCRLQTKFRRDISIHDWDITVSGFWKQTFAMLEFYSRFNF